jgi:ATP synthase protein I
MKMRKNGHKPPKKAIRAFLLVNLLGVDLVVCILAGYYLGSWLEKLTGQVAWLIVSVLAGVGIGVWTVTVLLLRMMEDKDG